MDKIYHLTTATELDLGLDDQGYLPARFPSDGFVHCAGSEAAVLGVARDYFGTLREDLVVLRIDPRLLDARLAWEEAAPIPGGGIEHLGAAAVWPHVYGRLARAAIDGVAWLRRNPQGEWAWPARFDSLQGFLRQPSRQRTS